MASVIAIKINSLLSYPLNAEQIEDWVLIFHELYPEIDPYVLDQIANKFITGEYDWNKDFGIQNLTKIFEAERKTSKIENNNW